MFNNGLLRTTRTFEISRARRPRRDPRHRQRLQVGLLVWLVTGIIGLAQLVLRARARSHARVPGIRWLPRLRRRESLRLEPLLLDVVRHVEPLLINVIDVQPLLLVAVLVEPLLAIRLRLNAVAVDDAISLLQPLRSVFSRRLRRLVGQLDVLA